MQISSDIQVGYSSTTANVTGTVVSKTAGSVTMTNNLGTTFTSGDEVLFYDTALDDKFSAPSGSVSISGNAGSWNLTVSADTGTDDFSGEMELYQGWGTTLVDDQAFTVTDLTPSAPTITSPTNEAIIQDDTPTITISGEPSSGHTGTDWQIATDSGFTTIQEQSINDGTNLTSFTAAALTSGTTYYIRVRTRVGAAIGPYSSTVEFTYWEVAQVQLQDGENRDYADASEGQSASIDYLSFGYTVGDGGYGNIEASGWLNDLSNPTIDDANYEIKYNSVTGAGAATLTFTGISTTFQTMNNPRIALTANLSSGNDSRTINVTIREIADPSNTASHDVTLRVFASEELP